MNRLICNGSNSLGNNYIIQSNNEILLIECGISFKDVMLNIDNMEDICGCVVSHTHLDHAEYIKQYQKYGIYVYSCQEVCDKYKYVKLLPLQTKTKIGNFNVQPIKVNHNVECYSFIITHPDIGKILFCTDLNSFPYIDKIKGLNHIFIEANYSDEILLDKAFEVNEWSKSQSENHLSIGQTIEKLQRADISQLQTIVLLHLSNGNSDAKLFRQMVKDAIGFDNVVVADKGINIELNKEDF